MTSANANINYYQSARPAMAPKSNMCRPAVSSSGFTHPKHLLTKQAAAQLGESGVFATRCQAPNHMQRITSNLVMVMVMVMVLVMVMVIMVVMIVMGCHSYCHGHLALSLNRPYLSFIVVKDLSAPFRLPSVSIQVFQCMWALYQHVSS